MYKLNPEYWGDCAAVPRSILQNHLKLAPGASFKVLLYILAGGEPCEEKAAQAAGLSAGDTRDALLYWTRAGVLLKDDPGGESTAAADTEQAAAVTDAADTKQPQSGGAAVKGFTQQADGAVKRAAARPLSSAVKKPTHSDISKRLGEAPELGFLFREAQRTLGAFGYDTQAMLLLLYDYYGFPADVVLMLIEYAKLNGNTAGKVSGKAMEELAGDWFEKGVKTLADAEREIEAREKISAVYAQLSLEHGFNKKTPTGEQRARLYTWLFNFGTGGDIISFAFTLANAQGAAGSFSAAGKYLAKWHKKGLRELEQIKRFEKTAPQAGKKPQLRERTYDVSRSGRERYYEELRREQALKGDSQ